MVIDQEILTLRQYLFTGTDGADPAWWFAVKAIVVLVFCAVVIRVLVNMLRLGPGRGVSETGSELGRAAQDVAGFSFRRVVGLCGLAWREAMRRHVWIIFVVFLIILGVTALLSGDTRPDPSREPAKLMLTFVLSTSTYLILFAALFLSTFSLPIDVKQRTIYTIVTKPVRAGEMVLGRILGFTFFGTVMLACMAICSYVFVERTVNHRHEIDPADVESFETASGVREQGETQVEQGHSHKFEVDAEGRGLSDIVQGHRHYVTKDDEGNYSTGPTEGSLTAKVPVYGKLRFIDRDGAEKDRGVSVGSEWTYRSYIPGGTLAAAIWKFENVTRENFPNRIPLDMTLRVFRTYKGNVERGIEASLYLVNPTTGTRTSERRFVVREFGDNRLSLPHELEDVDGKPLDLFEDIVDENGSMELWIRCFDNQQYLGVAQADVYLRAEDASYTWNFFKGYVGIWLQMVTVISIGVMFSTFLSGPVAMMATLACFVLGMGNVVDQIDGIQIAMSDPEAKGAIHGGGPIESFIRLVRQQNLTSPLDIGEPGETIIRQIDRGVIETLAVVKNYFLPKLGEFNYDKYVALGYNIPGDLVAAGLITTFGFFLAMFAIGYFCLKTREIAK